MIWFLTFFIKRSVIEFLTIAKLAPTQIVWKDKYTRAEHHFTGYVIDRRDITSNRNTYDNEHLNRLEMWLFKRIAKNAKKNAYKSPLEDWHRAGCPDRR